MTHERPRFGSNVLGASLRVRPRLWWTALRQVVRAIPAALVDATAVPAACPTAAYVRFRLETAYGARGAPTPPTSSRYLEWCRGTDRARAPALAPNAPGVTDAAGTLLRTGGDHRVARALLLNASFEPLCVVSSRRAVVLVLKEKAEIVHRNGAEFRSERRIGPGPDGHPPRALRPRAVPRDARRCRAGRCSPVTATAASTAASAAENLDHVLPRSRGGPHTWENVVASCRSCNARKEDRLPDECGMALRRAPVAPHATTSLIVSAGPIDPAWHKYLGPRRGRPA